MKKLLVLALASLFVASCTASVAAGPAPAINAEQVSANADRFSKAITADTQKLAKAHTDLKATLAALQKQFTDQTKALADQKKACETAMMAQEEARTKIANAERTAKEATDAVKIQKEAAEQQTATVKADSEKTKAELATAKTDNATLRKLIDDIMAKLSGSATEVTKAVDAALK